MCKVFRILFILAHLHTVSIIIKEFYFIFSFMSSIQKTFYLSCKNTYYSQCRKGYYYI